MDEYASLGHMKLVSQRPHEKPVSCYLPHHCVLKTSERAVKLRVVFDSSCKDSTGVSLNDALRVGPVVQQDLISILMRFRTFRYVITADNKNVQADISGPITNTASKNPMAK